VQRPVHPRLRVSDKPSPNQSAQVVQAGQAVLDGLELDGVQIESAVRPVRT
jgi:hypothetical protein